MAGTVEINSASNFVLLGDGYEGTRCVFGYSDVLDSNGYPTQLSSADAAKFVYDSTHLAPDSFLQEYRNQSDGSGVGEVGYGHVYARNSGPNPRGNQCHWTKFELMNNG